MSVTYSQIWTVEEMRSIAKNETDIADLITLNIIKSDAIANFLLCTGITTVLGVAIKEINEYIYFNPELVAIKIVKFIRSKSFFYIVGTTTVLYFTREGILNAIEKLENEGYIGITIIVKFSLPESFSDILNITDIQFVPF